MHLLSQNPKAARLRACLLLLIGFVVLCWFAYPFVKRTLAGEIIRGLCRGVPPAQLWADDLADDFRTKKRLAHLQEWAVQTLARYRAGQLATNGYSKYGVERDVKIAPKEIPDWLENAWGDPPEILILLNDAKDPQCINVGWYLSGLLIGPSNFVTTIKPWYIVQVKPGVYAYSVEK
jgi:hypothetical protein